AGGREREVVRTLLDVADLGRELAMHAPALVRRRRLVDGARVERVGERDPAVGELLDEAALQRSLEGAAEPARGGLCERRRAEERPPCWERQARDPPPDERADVRRHRERLVRAQLRGTEGAGDLQGEEGIAARGLVEAKQCRPLVGPLEPLLE